MVSSRPCDRGLYLIRLSAAPAPAPLRWGKGQFPLSTFLNEATDTHFYEKGWTNPIADRTAIPSGLR
jgi:hypothetical protein